MQVKQNSIQSLFHRLLSLDDKNGADHQPYLVLLQHSLAGPLRLLSLSESSREADEQVYRNAGVRMPSENASRDLESGDLWLKYVTNVLQEKSSGILWVQTSAAQPPSWLLPNTRMINLSNDPFGWLNNSGSNVENLGSLVREIEGNVGSIARDSRVPVVFDSLTPVLIRHGLATTISFLERLAEIKKICTLIVPVSVETLRSNDHRAMEDIAQAVLWLHGGEAVLLRQGVREKGNMVRESIEYKIVGESREKRRIEILVGENQAVSANNTPANDDTSALMISANLPKEGLARKSEQSSRKKVELQLEDDSAAGSKQPATPQIIIEDNDPEFDDYDDEDPDDDLEI